MEILRQHILFIKDPSQIAEARRMTVFIAHQMGFNEIQTSKLAIISAEMASNLVKHTPSGGWLCIRQLKIQGEEGIEVIAFDQGKGIANFTENLQDGYSTAGTLGGGLGAIQRLSQVFEFYSFPQHGTILMSQVFLKQAPSPYALQVGGLSIPEGKEHISGDAFAAVQHPNHLIALLVDGLGHGENAAQAAQEAVNCFLKNAPLDIHTLLLTIHQTLLSTRGAVAAIVEIDSLIGKLSHISIGNIAVSLRDEQKIRMIPSVPGTLGQGSIQPKVLTYPWTPHSQLFMCSDGIINTWSLCKYPGIMYSHPSLIATAIVRDFRIPTDDATAIVINPVHELPNEN